MAVNERFVAYISRKDDTNAIDENMSDMTEEKTDEPTAINHCGLLRPTDIDIMARKNTHCILNQCLALKNITNVMNRYKSYIQSILSGGDTNNNEQSKQSCVSKAVYSTPASKTEYNNVYLLNDFNHLSQHHSNQFEDIYNILNQTIYDGDCCKLSTCALMKRHCRNRSEITTNESLLTGLYTNNDDRTQQQLLDRVHCHFFHTFDVGYKLTAREKKEILDHEQSEDTSRAHQIISSKIASKSKMPSKQDKFQNIPQYSYGHRFYYWHGYKAYNESTDPVHWGKHLDVPLAHSNGSVISEWYIEPKHGNLKSEMLQNDICTIGETQWKTLLEKANNHCRSNNAKSMVCSRDKTAKWYDLRLGVPITVNQIAAMMIYCNFDLLSKKFTETYRKLNDAESDDDLIQRHRNYYWMGRYLRECVECFGMRHDFAWKSIKVYHGVNVQYMFPSLFAHIKGPFSTTRSYTVAAVFCGNKGMVLEMNMSTDSWKQHSHDGEDAYNSMACCDMRWISDYSYEDEIFCIGGLNPFRLDSIMEVTGISYKMYMLALEQMTFSMHFEGNLVEKFRRQFQFSKTKIDKIFDPNEYNTIKSQSTNRQKQLCHHMLAHELWRSDPHYFGAMEFKKCSDYFKDILHLHCGNVKRIDFREASDPVVSAFFCDDKEWVKLDVLRKIFPNFESMTYFPAHKGVEFLTDPLIYESILSFIKSDENKKRIGFEIIMDPKYRDAVEKVILTRKYKARFHKYRWKIILQTIPILKKVTAITSEDDGYKRLVRHKDVRDIWRYHWGIFPDSNDPSNIYKYKRTTLCFFHHTVNKTVIL
eukprot:201878_1